jgi:hypothetical protein
LAADKREKTVESLAVASALGFLVLLLGGLSLAADSRAAAVESAALVADRTTIALAGRPGDPAFERLYRISDGSSVSYGVVLSLRSPSSSALVAARFSKAGELRGLRLLDGATARLPADSAELSSIFPDAEAAIARAGEVARAAARNSPEAGS